MGKRTITVTLTKQGIEDAKRELERYKKEFLEKVDKFEKLVAQELKVQADIGFSGALVDDVINDRPKYAQVDVKVGTKGDIIVVIADGEDAVWVEFGAGVFHNTPAGTSPHSEIYEKGFDYTIGSYGKGMGKRQVWAYYEGGIKDKEKNNLRLTRGTPAKMPMANAMTDIVNRIDGIARDVFR